MKDILLNGVTYHYRNQFDSNLTLSYENNWDEWNVLREFISNALDAVGGNTERLTISEEGNFIIIHDQGNGYPISYALRIGASSKKDDEQSIGQFGEGVKMSLLTCLRLGIEVRLCSKNWLIAPRCIHDNGFDVLAFDIYEAGEHIQGSLVCIEATPGIKKITDNLDLYFLPFSSLSPLYGTLTQGIYPSNNQSELFNKGVYIKDINTMFTYALSFNQLNRDRDLVDDEALCSKIRDVWNKVDQPQLMQRYFQESNRMATGSNSNYKEFYYSLYPEWEHRHQWSRAFYDLYGKKAIISTNDLASQEARYLGYTPVKLEYCGRNLAELIGIPKDTEVISDDYEFTWANNLSEQEQKRLTLFRQISSLLNLDFPKEIKIYDNYAKSSAVVGLYNQDCDEIYLKRDRLNGPLIKALETFIHELNHKATGANDGDRDFADGLSTLSSKLTLELLEKIGIPMALELTSKGIRLPSSFSYQADKLQGYVAFVGNSLIIETNGHVLKAELEDVNLNPYAGRRPVNYHKGGFYISLPRAITQALPNKLTFHLTMSPTQI